MNLKLPYLLLTISLGVPFLSWGQLINTGSMQINADTKLTALQEFKNAEDAELINDGELILYNDYVNMGIVSFSPDKMSGFTRFVGSLSEQNIAGVSPMFWCNVDFKNNANATAAFILSGQVNIFGNANFSKGILDSKTNDAKIIFEKGAAVFSVSDDSYVDGTVLKTGNEVFEFPVGSQNLYRKAAISAPANTADTFSVRYFYEKPNNLTNLPDSVGSVDSKEYWIVKKENAVSDIILTLSWDDSGTTPSDITADPSTIKIVRWDDGSSSWVDEGGVVDKVNKTVSTPVTVKNYGIFTLAAKKTDATSDLVAVVYNAISANNDGINDYLKISGLENTQNTVSIFNRWGAEVFTTTNYDTDGNVFTGKTQYKGLLGGNDLLPSGTYFYVISYTENTTGRTGKKAGYLYIN